MSLFSIVQGRTPPLPPPRRPVEPPQPPMTVAPPAPIGAPYAPMGANIPAPVVPPQGAPMPSMPANMPAGPTPMAGPPGGGQMAQAPAQFPPPAMMRNIPGRAEGGAVAVPGYQYGTDPYAPTDGSDTGTTSTDGSGEPYMPTDNGPSGGGGTTNAGFQLWLGTKFPNATPDQLAAAANDPALLNEYGISTGTINPKAGAGITGGESATIGFNYAKLAQDALINEEARRDAYAKLLTDTGISQATLNQKNAFDQAQADQANRLDAGTLGLKAFDSNLNAMKQSGGDYNTATGAWTNAPTYTVNAGEAAGANIPRPQLGTFNIPGVPTADQTKAYATQ